MYDRLLVLRKNSLSQYFNWLADEDLETIAMEMNKLTIRED